MADRRKVGNLMALGLLALLVPGSPMHPYEMATVLRRTGKEQDLKIKWGSLYTVVANLEKHGLIEAVETSRAGRRPERTRYAITDAGRAELHDWLRELVEEPQHEYPGFVAALALIGALAPDEAVALLRRRLERLDGQRAEIRELVDRTVAGGVHPLFLVEEEYRVALLDADARFVGGLIERITDSKDGWAPLWAQFHAKETP
jgi:DNA-binding PadR family transcriptional regulator